MRETRRLGSRAGSPMSQQFRYTDLVLNPDFLLHSISLQEGVLNFVEVTRESYTKSAFLDGRIAFTRNLRHGLDLRQLMQVFHANPVPARPAHFIFHISFCCSTLLSRGLNMEKRCFSLREPYALIDLSHFKRSWSDPPSISADDWKALLDFVLVLLSKTYEPDEIVLIKPSNIANALISDILELRRNTRAILMYCGLRSFLIANLKKTEETKQKMWWLANMFAKDTDFLEHIAPIAIDDLTNLQAVALAWHLQMYHFQQHLRGPNRTRLRSLDCDALLNGPEDTLAAAVEFLGLAVSREEIGSIASGPVFSHHAKNPFERYGKGARDRENAEIADRHRDEITAVLEWSEERFRGIEIPCPLPQPLVRRDA